MGRGFEGCRGAQQATTGNCGGAGSVRRSKPLAERMESGAEREHDTEHAHKRKRYEIVSQTVSVCGQCEVMCVPRMRGVAAQGVS